MTKRREPPCYIVDRLSEAVSKAEVRLEILPAAGGRVAALLCRSMILTGRVAAAAKSFGGLQRAVAAADDIGARVEGDSEFAAVAAAASAGLDNLAEALELAAKAGL